MYQNSNKLLNIVHAYIKQYTHDAKAWKQSSQCSQQASIVGCITILSISATLGEDIQQVNSAYGI